MKNNEKVAASITRIGEFKEDETGVYFEYDPVMGSKNNPAPAGRLNGAHVLLGVPESGIPGGGREEIEGTDNHRGRISAAYRRFFFAFHSG